MQEKYVLVPTRLRRIPKSFSWVDHRIVRDDYISRCSHAGVALYLFLVTVADAQGLSYYADSTLMQKLRMTLEQLIAARKELIVITLIAYASPLYQVLGLDNHSIVPIDTAKRTGKTLSLQEILAQATKGDPS